MRSRATLRLLCQVRCQASCLVVCPVPHPMTLRRLTRLIRQTLARLLNPWATPLGYTPHLASRTPRQLLDHTLWPRIHNSQGCLSRPCTMCRMPLTQGLVSRIASLPFRLLRLAFLQMRPSWPLCKETLLSWARRKATSGPPAPGVDTPSGRPGPPTCCQFNKEPCASLCTSRLHPAVDSGMTSTVPAL